MVTKRILLIHGMGQHAAGWSQAVQGAIGKAAAHYAPYRAGRKLGDDVEFVEILYDAELQAVLGRWKSAAGALAAADGGEQIPVQLRDALEELAQQEQGDGAFGQLFWTHLMDPLLWCGWQNVRKAVIAALAPRLSEQVTAAIGKDMSLHLVAHSLGTSVLHDALLCLTDPALCGPKFDARAGGYRWASLTTFANVAPLLRAWQSPSAAVPREAFDPANSRVNPTVHGVIGPFFDVAHVSDPFTWPRPLQPTWQHAGYRRLAVRRWAEIKDVHTVELALADPDVARELLRTWLGNGMLGSKDEQTAARQAHAAAYPNEAPTLQELHGDASGNHGWNLKEIARYLSKVGKSLRKEGWQ
jgi:hypothetical protein